LEIFQSTFANITLGAVLSLMHYVLKLAFYLLTYLLIRYCHCPSVRMNIDALVGSLVRWLRGL